MLDTLAALQSELTEQGPASIDESSIYQVDNVTAQGNRKGQGMKE